jgi:hypothetical protein
MDNKLLQSYPSPDGKRWIELRQRSDGLFFFQEFYEATADDVPAYGAETFIAPGWQSGLYKQRKAAEADLQKMAPWLSEKSK